MMKLFCMPGTDPVMREKFMQLSQRRALQELEGSVGSVNREELNSDRSPSPVRENLRQQQLHQEMPHSSEENIGWGSGNSDNTNGSNELESSSRIPRNGIPQLLN